MGTPSPPDGYVLSRNYMAASRLNYQHHLWQQTLSFLLHPSIPLATTPPPSIADIATGTAVWLVDLARTLPPTAALDGYDISLQQCPPPAWLPRNITLHLWDMFTPPATPARYDVLHVRLVQLVVPGHDPRPLVRHLRAMLKPGGYLQWDELDPAGSALVRAPPPPPLPPAAAAAHPALDRKLAEVRARPGWVRRLPQVLREEGFEHVRAHEYREGVGLAKAFFDVHCAMEEEMVRARGGAAEGEGGAEALRGLEEIHRESVPGVVICTPKVVCVARKRGGAVEVNRT
ncbi:hypothetical protein MMC15_004850 [Xylographa vitiligo]|nr:hypothetical protein [Xylographa vitiligo]